MNKKWLALIILALVAWYLWFGPVSAPITGALEQVIEAPTGFDSGVSIEAPPLQGNFSPRPMVVAEDYVFTLMADFQLEARVLGRRNYRRDAGAVLSPIDLALGWGPMARDEVLAGIDISQRGRFYFWRTRDFPIPQAQIIANSANMHMIPASAEVFNELKRVKVDDTVRLRGYLVNIDRNDGWHWRTSMTRTDTGAGACEVVLVTLVQVTGGQSR
jgi:hypothetical protein